MSSTELMRFITLDDLLDFGDNDFIDDKDFTDFNVLIDFRDLIELTDLTDWIGSRVEDMLAIRTFIERFGFCMI